MGVVLVVLVLGPAPADNARLTLYISEPIPFFFLGARE